MSCENCLTSDKIQNSRFCAPCAKKFSSISPIHLDPEFIKALVEGKVSSDFKSNCPCGDYHSKDENDWRWPQRGEGKDRDARDKEQGSYGGCLANRMWLLASQSAIENCTICQVFMPLYRTFGWTVRSYHKKFNHSPAINMGAVYYDYCVGCCKKIDTKHLEDRYYGFYDEKKETKEEKEKREKNEKNPARKCPHDCCHYFCSRECISTHKVRHFIERHSFQCMRKECGKRQASHHFDEHEATEFAACYDCHHGRYCSRLCSKLDYDHHQTICTSTRAKEKREKKQ